MNLRLFSVLSLCVILYSPQMAAWGNLGHRTVAYVAEFYMTDAGLRYMRSILGNIDISEAAIWADWYKDTPEGKDTGSWHFINGHDNPPFSCNLDLARDCPREKGCIVSAIVNALEELSTASTPALEKATALKFLLHLIGDLHQPLHTEALARGGNDIPVLFGGKDYNLHFLWDVVFPQKITSSNETNEVAAAKSWAQKLHDYGATQASSEEPWTSSYQTSDQDQNHMELVRRHGYRIDALGWAAETNQLVCRYVLKDGLEEVKGKELNGSYYVHATPIIERLITLAGIRLGAAINALAEG